MDYDEFEYDLFTFCVYLLFMFSNEIASHSTGMQIFKRHQFALENNVCFRPHE
jgi:hypothetical protein